MDIEKGNLETLFLKIPYHRISAGSRSRGKRHDYRIVNEDLYMQYAQSVFPNYSEDERRNHYRKLLQDMSDHLDGNPSVFRFIMNIAGRLLLYDGEEITCRFDEMLRWREISFQLGQDFFTCAFLADHDQKKGRRSRNFSWLPIIRSDDSRLHNILKRGMAENHFHLNGSTKVFELNWICLMNLIDGRIHDFKKLPAALQTHSLDRLRQDRKTESFYAECQRAALYRVALFAVLRNNLMLTEKSSDLLQKSEHGWPMETLVSRIQDTIVLAKHLYGAKIDGKYILDYAFERDMPAHNDREYFLLAGERRFLYECYQASMSDVFTVLQKNLFYAYLSIRTHFRGELIQVNRQVGFANFSNYQDRKEIFIEGQTEYEAELIRLALNGTMQKQNIVSLEARICPKKYASELYKAIVKNQNIAAGGTASGRRTAALAPAPASHGKPGMEDKVTYVLHFPKIRDKKFCPGSPRNQNVRLATRRQAKSIASLLEQTTHVNSRIRGIDACSNELYCRPEVFAQAFRYLLDLEFTCRRRSGHPSVREEARTRLHATYHAGEDFLDIVDGLRAIDEAILFCGLKRGSRIGHGLALGVSPSEYYRYKGYKLVLPKQVLLDDIVWLINKSDETGCTMDSTLRMKLTEQYYSLYEEIYQEHMPRRHKASPMDYYQSWKLRGDNPKLYRLNEKDFADEIRRRPLQRWDRYALNDQVGNNVRMAESCRDLYFAYHYNEKVRKVGAEQTELKADQRYTDIVCQLQDQMIRKLVQSGIGIETNPSSNYLIGTIQKYEDHPILRFNSRKLRETEKNMSLHVSINTDDQGVFDTMLENEYALMALALRKAKGANHQPLYDIEDIYEWIDYVRRMGLEQVFI